MAKRKRPPKPQGLQRLNLRCYCCGTPLGNEIAIASSSPDDPPRIFTLLPEHAGNVEGVYEIVARDVRVHKHHVTGEG